MTVIVRNKKKNQISIIGFLFALITVSLAFNNNLFIANQKVFGENNESNVLRTSDVNVNGKPLLINQYSTITNSFFPTSLPSNISFILFNDWVSKNINIEYEGVSQKMQRVINGGFNTNSSGWLYKSNNPTEYINQNWQASTGNPPGCMQMRVDLGAKNKGDYGYYEQNITIPEKLSSGLISRLSMEYFLPTILNFPSNISVYLAVVIGNVETNITYDFETYLVMNTWTALSMSYDPSASGQIGPGNATIRVGIYTDNPTVIAPFVILRFDNVKFDLWTMPNEKYLVKAFDNEFDSNYTYTNSDFGKGYTFIDRERTRNPTNEVIFTIFLTKQGF